MVTKVHRNRASFYDQFHRRLNGFVQDKCNVAVFRRSTAMDERRKVARHRTLKAGSIAFNRAGGIDCRVRNLSPSGACLEVANQVGIPDDFVLVVEHEHLTQPCHVIWRSGTRLGVAFNA
jgi:hypothetical protein